TEIDLRLTSNNEVGSLTEGTGVLGSGVSYYQCPMDFNISVDEEINVNAVKKVFEILGNSSNYPLFFHCSIGTDRTGYIAWLINACLGVNEDDLYHDYLFSNFGNIGGKRTKDNIKNSYVKSINNTAGASLKEKAINYLLNKGVKQNQIDTLYSVML
ncbi:MAG: tyrosine-protein phosphatase, partial [Methanobrevibacter sp.]|nr:tyrosine-protein phosphatase [Methanobrevibacter sp.]